MTPFYKFYGSNLLLNITLTFSFILFRSVAESKHILKVNMFFNILLDFLSRKKKSSSRLTVRYIPWTAVLITLTQSFSVYTIQSNMVRLLQRKNSNNYILCLVFFTVCHKNNMECFLNCLYNSWQDLFHSWSSVKLLS